MPLELFKRILEDCRDSRFSDITDKYFVKYSCYEQTLLDRSVSVENSAYEHLIFYPRCSYRNELEYKNKKGTDLNGFCLELNQDEKIGYSRFVFGVRKEKKGIENPAMNSYVERIGTQKVDWFKTESGNPRDKRMKPLHWMRWCFLGNPNLYCQSAFSPQPSSFEDLIKNHGLVTRLTEFESLLFDWLLDYYKTQVSIPSQGKQTGP